jgi:hypothetical protein
MNHNIRILNELGISVFFIFMFVSESGNDNMEYSNVKQEFDV